LRNRPYEAAASLYKWRKHQDGFRKTSENINYGSDRIFTHWDRLLAASIRKMQYFFIAFTVNSTKNEFTY